MKYRIGLLQLLCYVEEIYSCPSEAYSRELP